MDSILKQNGEMDVVDQLVILIDLSIWKQIDVVSKKVIKKGKRQMMNIFKKENNFLIINHVMETELQNNSQLKEGLLESYNSSKKETM